MLQRPAGEHIRKWVNSTPNDGLILTRSWGNVCRLVATSPEALADVLSKRSYDFEKPIEVRNFLGRILGWGVLLVEGDEHRIQRKNLTAAFSFRHIKELYPTFWLKCSEGVNAITHEIRKNPESVSEKDEATAVVEFGQWASRITLDIIGITGMGKDFEAIQNPDNELAKRYESLLDPNPEKALYFVVNLMIPQWIVQRLPWKLNQVVKDAASYVREESRKIIRNTAARNAGAEKRLDIDILSVASESGAFTEDGLIDQLMTFLAAG
jgi:cytochrome P450